MHDVGARRCLQWRCQRIAKTCLYKAHKISKRRKNSDLRQKTWNVCMLM